MTSQDVREQQKTDMGLQPGLDPVSKRSQRLQRQVDRLQKERDALRNAVRSALDELHDIRRHDGVVGDLDATDPYSWPGHFDDCGEHSVKAGDLVVVDAGKIAWVGRMKYRHANRGNRYVPLVYVESGAVGEDPLGDAIDTVAYRRGKLAGEAKPTRYKGTRKRLASACRALQDVQS